MSTSSKRSRSASLSARSPQANKSNTSSTNHYQIVIVGGGAAGITTAAQLLKQDSRLNIA